MKFSKVSLLFLICLGLLVVLAHSENQSDLANTLTDVSIRENNQADQKVLVKRKSKKKKKKKKKEKKKKKDKKKKKKKKKKENDD